MSNEVCGACQKAAFVLRRIGFQDTISWGALDGAPSLRIHAHHANSGEHILREGNGEPPFNPARRYKYFARTSLCVTYRSELAWLMASRTTRTVVYMAHPISGNFERNVDSATKFLRYLRSLSHQELQAIVGAEWPHRPLIVAPYLAGIDEDGDLPGARELTLADCRATVQLCDELWWVQRVSDGMQQEASVAPIVRDLTHLRLPRRRK